MSMSPEATAQRLTVTQPSNFTSDEKKKPNGIRTHHRRPQKFFTTQRLPAFFAWTILLTTSFTYWICIFPEILVLLPHLLPIPIIHCVLFVLVCANFVLATFMDPVSIFPSFFIHLTTFDFPREFINNQEKLNQLIQVLILVLLKRVTMTMMMNSNLVLFAFERVDTSSSFFKRE